MRLEVSPLEGALCAKMPKADIDIFFGPGGAARAAKRVCNGDAATDPCPVRAACLELAVAAEVGVVEGERFGTFGGLSAKEREKRFGGSRRNVCRSKLRHEFTAENTYTSPGGKRRCVACRVLNAEKHRRLHGKGAVEVAA